MIYLSIKKRILLEEDDRTFKATGERLGFRELVALNIAGITPLAYRELYEKHGDDSKVLKEVLSEVKEEKRKEVLNETERELIYISKSHVKVLTVIDEEYPSPLRFIPDPPLVLYVRGELKKEDLLSIGVVGCRNPSIYGRLQAETLTNALVERGFSIISGLARGIDTIAHTTALKKGGRTIAVLGSGLLKVYPAENRQLASEIEKKGAVISEFPLAENPNKWNFPRRNRIISGLSLGSLVIEAGEKSGALITTKYALEQGREVFAVPGNVTSAMSKGTNGLIKAGAKLVESCDDVINELAGILPEEFLNNKGQAELAAVVLPEPENRVYQSVNAEPAYIDDIAKKCCMPVSSVSGLLVVLELKGLIRQFPGKYFVRI